MNFIYTYGMAWTDLETKTFSSASMHKSHAATKLGFQSADEERRHCPAGAPEEKVATGRNRRITISMF